MGKDTQRLAVVSKLFTEETLKSILQQETEKQDVIVSGWDFGEASAKGDSYLSTVDRITIHGTAGGQDLSVKIVVKSLPQNLGRRKTYRSTDFFYNEIKFYTEVVPVFRKFLESKNQTHLLLVPKCLAYILDGKNDFIAMNDVSVDGFGPISRQSTCSLEEFQLILTAMARFHGVSFAYKNQHEDQFIVKIAGSLKETYFSDEFYESWYETFHKLIVSIAKDTLAKEYPGTPEEKRFSSIATREFWNKSVKICGRSNTPTSVINQGDAWAPNFLMRAVDGKQEALLLDFQLARCAGPVSDISFFIYNCSDKTLRDREFDNLLKFYHRELSKTIAALGSDPNHVYSWETFQQEVQEEFVHGVCFGMEALPLSMLDDDENFDLDLIKGDEAVNIADIWTLKPLKNPEKRRRYADVLMHALQRGFL